MTTISADVVLLHGFAGTPAHMASTGATLRAADFQTHALYYESMLTRFDAIVARIEAKIRRQKLGEQRPLHFVCHSMGGLVARALIAQHRPAMLGKVVLMGTPNSGSEVADFFNDHAMLRAVLGMAGPTLATHNRHPLITKLPAPDYPLGNIAGNRPLFQMFNLLPPPHDGKVSVASTHVDGEADHIVLPVTHAFMPYDSAVRRQVLAFLRDGHFAH